MSTIPVVYSPQYLADLQGHVFPIEKYRLIVERLEAEGILGDVLEPQAATREELELVHTPEYLDDLLAARWTARTASSEMALTEGIAHAFLLGAGGSVAAARLALERGGPAMNVGGGLHHAFPGHAEGFCYVNDVALAVKAMLHEGRVERAAVIDCDLHQGNGTAVIFAGDADVFTFSIHEEHLYPVKQRSDLDVGLPSFAGDDVYLPPLRKYVPQILEKHRPEFVAYVAGADPYAGDQLGTLQLTLEGLIERDRVVLGGCRERGIPVAILLAGGYAARTEDTVAIHVNTYKVAAGLL
ncbi:MAG TPA: histone deacetylase [bacterium]|nr:histone deacetylase [bacterium]